MRRFLSSFHVQPINVNCHKHHIKISFTRSSGAGGQNVNKLSTKVELRVSLKDPWIPQVLAKRLQEVHSNRVNVNGELLVVSSRHRTQELNMKDAYQKLQQIFDEANTKAKERLPTEAPAWMREVRIKMKKQRSAIKVNRGATLNSSSTNWYD